METNRERLNRLCMEDDTENVMDITGDRWQPEKRKRDRWDNFIHITPYKWKSGFGGIINPIFPALERDT